MTYRTLFKSASFAVSSDAARNYSDARTKLGNSVGQPTPAASWWTTTGQHRLDTVAQDTANPTIAAAGTYEVDLSALTPTDRTYVRIVAPTCFTVAFTPSGGVETEVDCVGSSRQPGMFELTFESLEALTIENTGDASAAFLIAIANVVDYDDPSISNETPPVFTGAGNADNADLSSGLLPIGAIIAVGGYFTAAANGGTYSEALILPLPSWLKHCDGTIVNDSDSVLFGKYVPDLSDDRFIMGAGSTAAGTKSTLGNTRDVTHTHNGGTTGTASVNTTTRTTSVAISNHTITQPVFTVDSHTHNIAHHHQWGFKDTSSLSYKGAISGSNSVTSFGTGGATVIPSDSASDGTGGVYTYLTITGGSNASYYTTGVLSPPGGSAGSSATSGTASATSTTRSTDVALSSHSITQPTFTVDPHTHSFTTPAATFTTPAEASATTDIRPKWLAVKFYMRIK